ncbi:MAG TPA: M1 family metallopeptidase [Candidatus Angelobacter sp.]|jgi:aminopeptidase N/puromycin-sensitive aminopeptidase|nr:M1 family metallopeptidase [Candidatus Angelobacter sp.]
MSILRNLVFIACCIAPSCTGAQRLPSGVVPEHYSLTFTPDLATATFSGEEDIQIKLQRHGNPAITLNSAEIQIQKATVIQGGNSQEAQVSLDPAKEQATLALATPLGPGPASIHIHFTGILNDKLRGFYLAKTKLRHYAITQFEATDARRAFPSFDEPALKAAFDVTLIVDSADTAISNGRIISDTPGPGAGKHTLKFSTTPRMSTYLVAMAVGDFQCNEGQADGIPIRVCGTPDKKPLGEVALRYAEEILKYYNQYYGIQYPYSKLDIVGAPDFGTGAMENTAAIFYREALLFIDDKNSSLDSHAAVFVVLAHEMAHQWFGDLVTMKWWDNLWLNEGFANWMEKKPMQVLHPDWNAVLDAVKDTNNALRVDALRNTHAIRAKAETPSEINELFDFISYEKGAAVIRMIESYISPEVFRRGVNIYLRKFQYGNATAEDFWTTMAQASGRPVDKIMPTFVNRPGEPLVNVKTECITPKAQAVKTASPKERRSRKPVQPHPRTEITLSQQRFFLDGAADAGNQLWVIPVCIKTGENKPFCQLLAERQQVVSVAGCSAWVFTNTNSVGYYLTHYDAENWKKLSEVVVSGLTTAERMSLIDDEIALVTAGKEKIGSLLDLISAVNADPKREVVESYNGTLRFLDNYLITAADRESYHSWLRTVFRPMLAKVGWAPVPGESAETRSLRADLVIILGRLAQDTDTIKESTRLARQYLQDPNSIDPNLAGSVLVVAANAGDRALLNEYLLAMQHMTAPEQYSNITQSIAAFQGPELAERVLQEVISPGMRNQDAPHLIATELGNPRNHDYVWPWIKNHWADVEKKITAANGGGIVFGAGSFCDAASRDDVQRFFTEHKVPSSERALKQVAERINSCISYRERQQDNLAAWLGQHGGGGAVVGQQR